MTITAKDLHVFTARSNPLNWKRPHENWEKFATGMVEAGVSLTVIECAFGEEEHRCDDIEGVRHIPVWAKTRVWNKENLLNIGVHRTPDARYIAWIDADVVFRRPDWAVATLRALQHYDVVQPWSDAYDLGPNGEHMSVHRSFCRQYFHRQPVVPRGKPAWRSDGGPYDYPHSGYAWAITRQAFDWVVDLPPRAVAALANIPGDRIGRVFRKPNGDPYRSTNDTKAGASGGQIKRAFATAVKNGKIVGRRLTPHHCRHTWATWHYLVYRDPYKLRDDGAWHSASMVERYAKLAPATMLPEVLAFWGLSATTSAQPPADDRLSA